MPPRSRGHGDSGDGPDDGQRSRPWRGDGSPGAGSARQQEDLAAEILLAGRSTADGGTGGRGAARPGARDGEQLTLGTGQPGGRPSGPSTYIDPDEDATVQRSLEMENSGAAVLADRGYRIQQNPTKPEVAQARQDTGDVGNPAKDPDYLIEGRVFDCYSPVKVDKVVRGIWSETRDKVDDGQTQRVVVNLEDWRGDLSALRKQFADWPIRGLKEVKAISRDGEIVQIDLPPYQPWDG